MSESERLSLADVTIPTPDDLRLLRVASGVSQQDVAGEADVSVGTVSDIERGVRNPRLGTVIDVVHAIRVLSEREEPESAEEGV